MKNKLLLAVPLLATGQLFSFAQERPNIIFIFADDMGYGDVSALNPSSKIQTPSLDGMAARGVVFSDAHTSSSVSTPSRYALLTGRYNWRSPLKSGVLSGYSNPLIPKSRTTVASMLKRAGYTTGCVGKWHLGWKWDFTEPPTAQDELSANNKGVINYSSPIKNGPTTLGFDYFYGFSGSLDMPPYVYVENDMATALPDREVGSSDKYGWFRNGPTGSDFVHEDVTPHLTDKAIAFIERESSSEDPFFLYIPYPSPHTPILPSKEWQGKSGLNPYGDFVMMVDDQVGRIISELKRLGIEDNTLIIFSTDNGCSPAAKIEELEDEGHYPNYIYRGTKADLFEGGHRVPCIIQWPEGAKEQGKVSDQTICLSDFFSTFADIAGVEISDKEGEDSYSILPAIKNPDLKEAIRPATIHHSIIGEFAIRSGDWKLLVSPSSGGWSAPHPNNQEELEGLPPMQLYNLADDPAESNNLYSENPEKVSELLALLRKQIEDGRSTPGEPQRNEVSSYWKQLNYIYQMD